MLDRAHVLLRDDRRDLRINEDERLSWRIKYKQREGYARVKNISASGMLIETDVPFNPKEDCVLSFDSTLGVDNYIPRLGRLVWNRKKRFTRNKYFCGIKFLDADEDVLTRMRARIKKGISRFMARRRIVTTIGFFVCAAAILLIEYIVHTSSTIYRDVSKANEQMSRVSVQQALIAQDYTQRYRASEARLAETTEKLDIANEIIAQDKAALALFSKELEATGALLTRTEEMLDEANDRNVELGNRNTELSKEIAALQAQVQAQIAREQSVAAVADVEMSMAEYRQKLQSIKNEMRLLRQKEYAAKVAARAKIDDKKLLVGNNGFFVKSGQAVEVNEEQYNRLEAGTYIDSVVTQAEREVEIDVTFFDTP